MTKHIDADKLKAYYAWWGEDSSERTLFDAIIDVQPAADVVEVRHGRWERVDYGNGCYNYHCSSCRHIPRENIRSNYCPNCGADMREV